MKRLLGNGTIGQSPRSDIMPDILPIRGDIEMVEGGALDGFIKEKVTTMAPLKSDSFLGGDMDARRAFHHCRGKVHITPKVEKKIRDHFWQGRKIVPFLCRGEFPSFGEEGLLIRPQRTLYHVVQAVAEKTTRFHNAFARKDSPVPGKMTGDLGQSHYRGGFALW